MQCSNCSSRLSALWVGCEFERTSMSLQPVRHCSAQGSKEAGASQSVVRTSRGRAAPGGQAYEVVAGGANSAPGEFAAVTTWEARLRFSLAVGSVTTGLVNAAVSSNVGAVEHGIQMQTSSSCSSKPGSAEAHAGASWFSRPRTENGSLQPNPSLKRTCLRQAA